MRNLVIVLSALVLMYCTPKEKPMTSIQGAYRMISQSSTNGTEEIANQASQLKIYTDTHMIFAGMGADSTSYFGIGTYTINEGVVTENVLTNGEAEGTTNTFTVEVSKTEKGYKQVIRDMEMNGEKRTLMEEYESVGTGVTSPFDGAWKCTNRMAIAAGDTTTATPIQYKVYHSGNFIWAHSYADSTGTNHTGFGYGTFNAVNDHEVTESLAASAYNISGQSFTLHMEMPDANHFKQTINNEDGTSTVEEYERLMK